VVHAEHAYPWCGQLDGQWQPSKSDTNGSDSRGIPLRHNEIRLHRLGALDEQL